MRTGLLASAVITASILAASGAQAAIGDKLDRSKLDLTFKDEFNAPLSVYDAKLNPATAFDLKKNVPPVWKTSYYYGNEHYGASGQTLTPDQQIGGRTIPQLNEIEVYVDNYYCGSNPFDVKSGVLSLKTWRPSVLERSVCLNNRTNIEYLSGLITTQKSFSQMYGYFEVRAKLPAAPGTWPAFWLLPTEKTARNGGSRPEFDVFEEYNGPLAISPTYTQDRTGRANHTIHYLTQEVKKDTCGQVMYEEYYKDAAGYALTGPGGTRLATTACRVYIKTPGKELYSEAALAPANIPGQLNGTANPIPVKDGVAIGGMIYSPGKAPRKATASDVQTATTDFHTYGFLWTKDELVFYIDDIETYRTVNPSSINFPPVGVPKISTDQPSYILLNTAVSRKSAGEPNTAGINGVAPYPTSMDLDYVRAYKIGDGSATASDTSANSTILPRTASANAIASNSQVSLESMKISKPVLVRNTDEFVIESTIKALINFDPTSVVTYSIINDDTGAVVKTLPYSIKGMTATIYSANGYTRYNMYITPFPVGKYHVKAEFKGSELNFTVPRAATFEVVAQPAGATKK